MSENDEARRAILARRARFIAAAMAGSGVVGCDGCLPRPCLEPPVASSAEPVMCLAVPPSVCLSPPPLPPPDGTDAGVGDAGDAGPPEGRAQPCLKPALPRPCLSPVRRK